MNNLLNTEELIKVEKILNNLGKQYNIFRKLLNSYKYYKNRVTELELEIDDLLDRDLI